jgi:hypothetical protein
MTFLQISRIRNGNGKICGGNLGLPPINPDGNKSKRISSDTGTRTLVSCVKGKYANHLHHIGMDTSLDLNPKTATHNGSFCH